MMLDILAIPLIGIGELCANGWIGVLQTQAGVKCMRWQLLSTLNIIILITGRCSSIDTEFYVPTSASAILNQRCFEAKWFKEEGFGDVVQDRWMAAQGDAIDVHARLRAMHAGLHDWDRRVLKRPKQTLRQAQHELDVLMRGPLSPENDKKKHDLAKLIEKLLEQEEIKWSQRSHANWLQNGDINTAFFHSFASARKKRNHIKQLKDPTLG